MNGKANFLKQRELVKWWVSIAHDDRFAQVCTHARAMMVEATPSKEQMEGSELFLQTLETMTDGPDGDRAFPTPGLHHNPDTLPPRPAPTPESKPKKKAN